MILSGVLPKLFNVIVPFSIDNFSRFKEIGTEEGVLLFEDFQKIFQFLLGLRHLLKLK